MSHLQEHIVLRNALNYVHVCKQSTHGTAFVCEKAITHLSVMWHCNLTSLFLTLSNNLISLDLTTMKKTPNSSTADYKSL